MKFLSRISRFAREDFGGMTAFMVLWMIIFFIMAGLAVDGSNAWRERAVLQATADASAHAAIIDIDNTTVAANKANEFAELNMPAAMFGDVLYDSDIEFGNWTGSSFLPVDPDVVGAPAVNAVRVTTFRAASNANRLRTYFLTLTGFTAWDISARAVAARYKEGTCLTYDNVIMADGQIHLNPGATYEGEICIHSNDHLRIQPDVTFANGAYASMPDDDYGNDIHDAFMAYNPQIKLNKAGDDFPKAPGLYDALEGNDGVELLSNDLNTMLAATYGGVQTFLPAGDGEIAVFNNPLTVSLDVAVDALPAAFLPGTIYHINCGGLGASIDNLSASIETEKTFDFAGLARKGLGLVDGLFGDLFTANAGVGISYADGQLSIATDVTGVALITDCKLHLGAGTYIDSLFASTAPDQAIHFANNDVIQVGRDDDCAPGGDTHFWAPNGDIHSSAKSNFYDAHFLGGKDFHLAAQGGGDPTGEAVGINVQVAGEAHITALANFNGCGNDGGVAYAEWHYRLVQ